MAEKNNAKLIDPKILIQAGIDPKTGLPVKAGSKKQNLKPDIKRALKILDRQNAINRYKWYGLPDGLEDIIERVLYYKGQGILFYLEFQSEEYPGKFYFLPYALNGNIDIYGRYELIRPLPFNGSTSDGEKGKKTPLEKYLTSITREPVYDIWLDEVNEKVINSKCVILHDHSIGISQTNIPREQINDPIIDLMSDCLPFMRTALLNSTGVSGMRVNSEDEQHNVQLANASIDNAALTGDKYISVIGNLDFQELTTGNVSKSEEFLLAMQSLDNLRLSLFGLDNGGLFQKKSHMLEAEQEMNTGNVGLIYQDGLKMRQKFCDIVNSIWGLGISCEPSETVIGLDTDNNGVIYDDKENEENIYIEEPNIGGEEDV